MPRSCAPRQAASHPDPPVDRHLALTTLGLLNAGDLPAWEAYRDRLLELTGYTQPDSEEVRR